MQRLPTSGDTHSAVADTWSPHAISVAGASHVRDNIVGQDASAAGLIGAWGYAIVSDGHGSDRHFRSDVGAKLAVSVLEGAFRDFVAQVDEEENSGLRSTWVGWADRFVVAKWHQVVAEHIWNNPDWEQESLFERHIRGLESRHGIDASRAAAKDLRIFGKVLRHYKPIEIAQMFTQQPIRRDIAGAQRMLSAYGATLLGLLVGDLSVHTFQLGDGYITAIQDPNRAGLVQTPSDEAMANATPSLCSTNAVDYCDLKSLRLRDLENPFGFILTTDGVSNSYATFDGFLKFCTDVCYSTESHYELPRWLGAISARGSGDDMSVAMLTRKIA